jgi:hypothetical protein
MNIMGATHTFPFGQPLRKVEQKNRSDKKAFVLGVYASAVHATWVDKYDKQKVSALAVASEPEIFWKGENAEEIISKINIPKELGELLVPKSKQLNGPSGKVLDDLYLNPLGLTREDTWLCDLLPESRVNENQAIAISKHYTQEIIDKYNLPQATVPLFDKKELNSAKRRNEILQELEESKANTLILLGDLPIKWFLNYFDIRYSKLSQFRDTYGLKHLIVINERQYKVIPLCHPRQAGRLGRASKKWGELHDNWVKTKLTNK